MPKSAADRFQPQYDAGMPCISLLCFLHSDVSMRMIADAMTPGVRALNNHVATLAHHLETHPGCPHTEQLLAELGGLSVRLAGIAARN